MNFNHMQQYIDRAYKCEVEGKKPDVIEYILRVSFI